MKHLTLALALGCTAGTGAMADEFAPAMKSYLDTQIATWANDPVLLNAIRTQNAANAALTQADIEALDLAWRAEVGTAATLIITPVLDNAASAFLRDRVAAPGGAITEAFIMDAHGLNVAASDVTSDYWQGDEEKFSETFPKGANAIHISDVEMDESTQTFQGQISLTITDPTTNEVLGAMTVRVNAESLL